MATFFGEVILPSSRAFFEDDDDSGSETEENPNQSKCQFKIVPNENVPDQLTYPLFLISDGLVARDFFENFTITKKEIVARLSRDDGSDLLSGCREPYFPLNLINDSFLYLEAPQHLDLHFVNHLTTSVSGWLEKSAKVVIVASRSSAEFKCSGTEAMLPSFLKTLSTDGTSTLQIPNFVTGLSASALSWCEVRDKPCSLHILYTDTMFTDSLTLQPLVDHFTTTYPHLVVKNSPHQKLSSIPSHLMNMYH